MKIVGDTRLEEAVKDHPEDALRVFIRINERDYTDESPVCKAGPVEYNLYRLRSNLNSTSATLTCARSSSVTVDSVLDP